MTVKARNLLLCFVAGVIVVASATVEDWYGRFDYSAEAPGYLDGYLAVDRGDWNVALSPHWSIGYPLLISATRWMFPAGPEGEWTAIHVLNLVIFLATYLSFLYFLRVATTYAAFVNGARPTAPEESWNVAIFSIGTSVFLLWQLITGNVSRISPDLSISCVFFLVTATCLNFFMRPGVKTAAALGLLMGIGYLLKVGFLPASFLTLSLVWLHGLIRSPGERLDMSCKLACALPVMGLLVLPYALGISKEYGKFTFGESGGIIYAWYVNHLPGLCNWQGGPAPFGTPIHPTHLVWKNPPVFTFAEPFDVTYPPYYNIPYYYEGFHQFFKLGNQLAAIKDNLSIFRRFFTGGDHAEVVGLIEMLLVAGALFLLKERLVWARRLLAMWPLYVLTLCPIGVYVLVHIEPRYVIGPIIVLLVAPFLPLFVPTPLISSRAACGLAVVLAVGCGVLTLVDEKDVLGRMVGPENNTDEPGWRTGLYLQHLGIRPGTKVAAVGYGSCIWDTWAYVCGAHIVAEIGNYAYDLDDQNKDLRLFAGSPDVQQTVFQYFRQAGATLVVARELPEPPQGPGWVEVPGTQFWIHSL